MLAWYASNPDHGGNPDLSANPPPASSPHFRPTMQSPGPPYQSTMGSAMNYSERPYENHMTSHCQSGSYPSYQPPSPYRPHPVSPPAHAHQYGAHGGHQMHGGLGAYGSGHQLGPYGSAPSSHYASLGPPDLYGGRPPSMYGSGRAMQQMKSAWGGESNSGSSADLMQYSQPSPRPMMPPPPTMHSPPHAGIGGGGSSHYRQVPIVSGTAAGHSPHSWTQSQIPSPGTGVLHSPRTTPSPLPAHTRSPAAGAQPFSPPPAAPSPQQQQNQHHPPPSMTPLPPHKTTPSPPSGATTPAPNSTARQTVCESPSGTQGPANSDPLQSLQKMVMLDSETVESPITRANYEMAANQAAAGGTPNAPVTGRPASYFSVEQLAGNEPGSPYPTYYNLDQNRLCTPPRTNLSTPTSSTFSSAPDSASSNSPRSDSRTTTASADSNHVAHVNGDVNHHPVNPIAGPIPTDTPQPPPPPPPPPRRPDFGNFGVAGMRMTNGNHQPEAAGLRDDLGGPISSDSENKDTQDFLQHLGGPVAPLPEPDGTVDLRRKSPKSPRGRRRVFGHDLQCDPLMDGAMDISRNKPMMMPPDERRNSALPEFETLNGKPESCDNVYPTDGGYAPRPPRYYSPTNRWNKMGPLEDGFMGIQQSKPYPDEYLPMPKPSKRGRKKKMFDQDGIVSEWDMYNSEVVHRPPRISRGGSRGRRGSRRRGAITSYPANNGDVPMDMYSSDPMMSMRNHPSNGMGDMVGTNNDKDLPWGSQNYHMGPPSSGMGTDYGSKDNMSVIKPPMIDSHSMDNSSMNNNLAQSQPPNYQSDVPSDDRGRGPLLFTVNKDGSTVKLQDNGQTNNSNVQQQQQYYDPVLGQMVPQPIKKKRGRPFGSKNKPKPPGEERQPRRRRKKEVFFGPEGPPPTSLIKRRIINGPYVHIVGVRNKPLVVSVVNQDPKDENSDSKYWPQKQQPLQFGGVIRQNMGMGTSPTLPHIYDTITKDRSWLCSLCCKNSHYRGLGDLFGPYYLNGDQKPSNYSSPPSPAPMSTFGNESSEPGDDFEPEDSREGAPDPSSCSDTRRYPGKRKSDVMEQMFRAALLRKAKQANGQKPLEEMSNHMSGVDMSHSNPNQFPPVDTPPADNKEFWVHEECAVWSKSVYLFGHRLRGLEDTVLQSVDKLCSRCKFPGASLSCACENCPELYHYLCARDNWCYMDEDTYTIYCPQHKVKPFIIRVGEDQIEELELNAKR